MRCSIRKTAADTAKTVATESSRRRWMKAVTSSSPFRRFARSLLQERRVEERVVARPIHGHVTECLLEGEDRKRLREEHHDRLIEELVLDLRVQRLALLDVGLGRGLVDEPIHLRVLVAVAGRPAVPVSCMYDD